MKRLRLFLAAIAVLSGLGLNAQSWTGSEVGEGYALLYNVGTGQYLTRGNGWGTQASIGGEGAALTVDLKAFDGKYKIRTASNGRGLECLSGGTVYTDQSISKNATWTFTEVDATNHIYNIISADNHGGGSENYLTAEGGESTIVGPGADGTSANAKWKIYLYTDQQEKLQTAMANATAEAPVDVTAYIKDGNFGAMSINNGDMALEFWTVTANNKNLNGGLLTNPCAETYRNGGGKISQTITVPNGTYLVKCQGFYRIDGGSTPSYLYANDETPVALQVCNANGEETAPNMDGASASFSASLYDNNEIQVTVSGKTLTFGIEGQDGNWTCFDNFRLFYLGPLTDFSAYDTTLSELSQEAANLEGKIPEVAYTALNDVVSANNKSYSTANEYDVAIANINTALNAAKKLVDPYAAYKVVAANAVFAGVDASEQNTAVEQATTVEGIEACTAALQTAIDALAFDVTSFTIKNPNAQTKDNWEGTDFGGQSDGVTEYWNVSPAGFYQTINLPAGKYRMTVIALQRLKMTGTVYAGGNSTIIAQVGNPPVNSRGQAAAWFAAGNGRNYVYFELTEATDITIGLKADETLGDHWTVWKSFKLDTFDESVAAGFMAPGWTKLKEEAQATHDDAAYANVTGEEKTALETAIAATPSTIAEYQAAVEALNAAVAAFTAAAPAYNAYAAYKAETIALWGTDFDVAAPNAAAEAEDAMHNLNIAQYNKVATDYTFSCTGLIGDFGSWTGTATVAGEPGTPNYLDYEHWSGVTHAYYEQDRNGWGNNAGWTVKYEKTCTLPAGSYVIKVAARSSAGTTSLVSCSATETTISLPNVGATARGINKAGEASWTDGEFVNNGNGFGWQWRFLPFTLAEETEVTMTFYAEATTGRQWMSIADGELLSSTKLAQDIVFNETQENVIENTLIADVTVNRNIKVGYNTVVLPFQLTANQVTAAFGEGTEVYNYSENSEDKTNVSVYFDKGDGSIAANTPVLVKATVASESQTFEGVQIVNAEPKAEGKFFDFVGIYSPLKLTVFDYIFGNDDMVVASRAATVNGFSAYFKSADNAARVKHTFIGGAEVTTGIEGIMTTGNNNGKIYNLNGQEVKSAQKGLYIQNGKKVFVK